LSTSVGDDLTAHTSLFGPLQASNICKRNYGNFSNAMMSFMANFNVVFNFGNGQNVSLWLFDCVILGGKLFSFLQRNVDDKEVKE